MEIENIYPHAKTGGRFLRVLYENIKWLLFIGAIAAVIVNLAVGGKRWSYVVVVSCVIAWSVLYRPTIQASIISRGCVLASEVAVLLAVIDSVLAPGWASFVIPMLLAATLAALAALFFADRRRQTRNVMPLVISLFASTVACAIIIFMDGGFSVPLLVLAALSLSLLIAAIAALRGQLISEAKKYFHTK
ncbi:MAG: hypothetical protein IJP67_02405 [Oscillospiraceae bacterium]|nr:hypothetical protein [Oscillospiraceae bacterium]MBR0062997.1 hypothetical protein [Oscillospiraceae bacterium]